MKISKLMLLLVLAIGAVGCNKDDDGPEPYRLTNANIAGSYKTIFLKGHMEQTFTVNNVDILSVTDVVGDTFQLTTVFKTDGTYLTSGQYRAVTTNTTGGQTTTNSEIILVDQEGTYVLNPTSNTITIVVDNTPLTFDVTSFNSNQIKMVHNSNAPVDGVPTTSRLEIHLERQ